MAKSSVPHGFTTTILVSSGFSDYLTIATILQSELKPLGINLKIQQLDPNTANPDQQSLKYDMTLTYWTMDIPDPDELATFGVDPNSGARSFFTAYNNPTVVKATHDAEQTLSTAARQSLYNTVQSDSAATCSWRSSTTRRTPTPPPPTCTVSSSLRSATTTLRTSG